MSDIFQVDKGKAMKLYHGADAQLKKVLEELFDAEALKKQTALLYSIEECCEALNTSYRKEIPDSFIKVATPDEVAYRELKLIVSGHCAVIKWKCDPGDPEQYKYYPYFEYIKAKSGSGFGLACHGYGDVFSGACVGSRLTVGTPEQAIHIGTFYNSVYEKFFL